MRKRMLSAEERAHNASLELEQLRHYKAMNSSVGADGSGRSSDTAILFKRQIDALNQRLADVEADHSQAINNLQAAEEAMSRALREKALIEERYLALDSKLVAA
jgi:hypothetical protein